MANTYTLISSNTLSSSAASVTFSSIPSTYTDLVIKLSARDSNAGTRQGKFRITFNSDSATNYSQTWMYGQPDASATPYSGQYTSNTVYYPPQGNGDSAGNTSNTFTSMEIYIPNYLVSQNKPMSTVSATEDNATGSLLYADAGLWRNTAAITTISIVTTGSYIAGSSFYLYGVKNS